MEDSRKEALLDLEAGLSELKSRVEEIERKIGEYKALYGSAQQDDAEMIDLGNEDFLNDISVVGPESASDGAPADVAADAAADAATDIPPADAPADTVEDVTAAPSESAPADIPDDLPADDGESLFGEVPEDSSAASAKAEEKASDKPHKSRNLNERNSSGSGGRAVMDVNSDKPAWLSDMIGPEVKDIRSAISLNDRVMFITSLFREDSMLFQDTVTRLNGMTSLDKAAAYLGETFPEWNMNSEQVYRFMMAVRRKIRH